MEPIKKKIIYAKLATDLFRLGHLQFLKYAKSLEGYVICGIVTGDVLLKEKDELINTTKEIKEIVSGIKYVDRIVMQDDADPTINLKSIHKEFPNCQIVLLYGKPRNKILGADFVKSIGGRLVKHPYYSRISRINAGKAFITGNIISTKANTLNALKPLLTNS